MSNRRYSQGPSGTEILARSCGQALGTLIFYAILGIGGLLLLFMLSRCL